MRDEKNLDLERLGRIESDIKELAQKVDKYEEKFNSHRDEYMNDKITLATKIEKMSTLLETYIEKRKINWSTIVSPIITGLVVGVTLYLLLGGP